MHSVNGDRSKTAKFIQDDINRHHIVYGVNVNVMLSNVIFYNFCGF